MPTAAPHHLLADDDPAPFEATEGDAAETGSPFVVICDHAGRQLPRALGNLGLSPAEMATHVAWDIGAGEVARRLARALGAFVACQRYSRLVIDCNRSLTAPDSIVTRSERTDIPGNRCVTATEAEARARAVFEPYHARIRAELDRRRAAGLPTMLVSMHSFTPVFMDVARPWQVGVLFNRDTRIAEPLLRLLRAEHDLDDRTVGCNQPYAVDDHSDYSVNHHGEQREIPYVEIEIRQDLIADTAGQIAWAERFARLLPAALPK